MSDYFCFLVTVYYEFSGVLLRCALKVRGDHPGMDDTVAHYPMETESLKYLHTLLPDHVRSCGPIVQIEQIFEITTLKKEPPQ